MPSLTVSFNINDSTRARIYAEQKRRKRMVISLDLFCKQLIMESLDASEIAQAKKDVKK